MHTHKECGLAQTTVIFAGTLILVAAVSVFIFSSGNNQETVAVTESDNSQALPVNTGTADPVAEIDPVDEDGMSAMAEVKEMMGVPEVEGEVIVAAEPTASEPGVYTDYDPALLANASSGDVVLFFHAKWCPSCRALESDIKSNLGAIPSDVTIMVVDFDTAQDLKVKYGVNRQHTLVQVDANGNEIKKLTGLTNSLSQVVGQL
tara:strand:- start:2654 stop:3265 length:612 start_codon:yes stop_codon:yes gene_type:complete